MLLAVLAFLGGALTIISPCILPVLPFVFARQDRSFRRGTLPLLAGMAVTFAGLAALALLAVFGVALLSKAFADWIARPFVALGNRVLERQGTSDSVLPSAL